MATGVINHRLTNPVSLERLTPCASAEYAASARMVNDVPVSKMASGRKNGFARRNRLTGGCRKKTDGEMGSCTEPTEMPARVTL